MKKCKDCKYFAEQNEYHNLCLCLFFCEDVIPNNKCISEKRYIENEKYILNDILSDYNNLMNKINSTNKSNFTYKYNDIAKIVWVFGNNKENCKLLIQNYLYELKNEINKYDECHID